MTVRVRQVPVSFWRRGDYCYARLRCGHVRRVSRAVHDAGVALGDRGEALECAFCTHRGDDGR